MKAHETQLRVRYAETDQMGVVYYGNYALYYEVGRAEWLRQFGMTYADLERKGVIMPVTRLDSRFLRPAHYDQLLTIRTSLKEMPNRRITFVSEVMDEDGELLSIGEVTLAFLDKKSMKVIDIPSFLMEKIEKDIG